MCAVLFSFFCIKISGKLAEWKGISRGHVYHGLVKRKEQVICSQDE